MKIDLFDVDEFVELNQLREITSDRLIQRHDIKDPDGLISDEIFGVTIKSRKETFAYIDLHSHFFHPHIYKAFKRLFRNVEKIINGEQYFSIDKNGFLVKDDENGQTGIEFLYDNWEKIKWEDKGTGGQRDERIDLLTKTPKRMVFMSKQIVIPVFYRDVTGGSSSGGKTGDINNLYSRLIRYGSMIQDKAAFDWQLHSCYYNIQNTLVDIYDYFKVKLEKKHGMIRQYLMGKRVDYCTREVITGPQYHGERPEDNLIDFNHVGVPISSLCALVNPYLKHWLKQFFDNAFSNEQDIPLYDPKTDAPVTKRYTLKNPLEVYNEKFFEKMLDTYIRDPESRFNKFEIPVVEKATLYMYFSGTRLDPSNKSELSSITYRPMTWTDLLFIACNEIVKDKHILVTRYPLNDEFGVFINHMRVVSTIKTQPAEVNGKFYKFYPVIDLDLPKEKIAAEFVDSLQFSNSFLKGLSGDYDGDQITAKVVYTQEANAECEKFMNSKQFFLRANGTNARVIENEAIQTFYTMTRDPNPSDGAASSDSVKLVMDTPISELTLSTVTRWLSNTFECDGHQIISRRKPIINLREKVRLGVTPSLGITSPISTTLGRILWYRLVIEASGMNRTLSFVNKEVTSDVVGELEEILSTAITNGEITPAEFMKYIDNRDWVGLVFHGSITSSFSPGTLKKHPEIETLKKELLKKYEKEIAAGDPAVSELIENALIAKAKEILKGDPGMELYDSGARGSFGNNYKNMYLFRGAVQRPYDGKYDIITNSFSDGLQRKDIAPHANSIVNGAYPKSVATSDTGYLAKQLLAAFQTESLDEPGSDCGTRGTLPYVIPSNYRDFEYRYIQEGGKLICLTPDIIKSYIGKRVNLRTPMKCIGKKICNKCAGDYYYKLGKVHAGLLTSIVATTCTELNMKKFHSNLIKVKPIDLDDMLI